MHTLMVVLAAAAIVVVVSLLGGFILVCLQGACAVEMPTGGAPTKVPKMRADRGERSLDAGTGGLPTFTPVPASHTSGEPHA